MHENCNQCDTDYDITAENGRLHLFIENYIANHVEAKCTHCGNVEVIFVTPAGLVAVVKNVKLHLELHIHADKGLQERANAAWGRHSEQEAAAVTLPTHDLTDRHEQELAGFASSIEAMPAELFWTFIEDDTNKDKPERWA